MPRWAQITLCIVLFTAGMLAVRAGLHATVPSFVDWLNTVTGQAGATALIFAVILAAGIYGWWPRDERGQMRPLPRRR